MTKRFVWFYIKIRELEVFICNLLVNVKPEETLALSKQVAIVLVLQCCSIMLNRTSKREDWKTLLMSAPYSKL
jgi:hypothetical protein